MVTTSMPRKSRRPSSSHPAMASGMASACSSASGGKRCGRWCLRITISTSTPKSSGWPRISITRPTGLEPRLRVFEHLHVHHHAVQLFRRCRRAALPPRCGRRQAPPAASPAPRGSRSTAGCARRAGPRNCPRRPIRNSPTTVGCARLSTLTISPSARPPGLDAADAHHHPVAVHGLLRRFRRDEDVPRDPRRRLVGD